jgi:hypothetical protein
MADQLLWIFGNCLLQRRQRLGVADAGHDVLALGVHEEVAVLALLPVAGSRVKPTPVPERSSRLPKTIACTFTAVPRSWAMRSRSR